MPWTKYSYWSKKQPVARADVDKSWRQERRIQSISISDFWEYSIFVNGIWKGTLTWRLFSFHYKLFREIPFWLWNLCHSVSANKGFRMNKQRNEKGCWRWVLRSCPGGKGKQIVVLSYLSPATYLHFNENKAKVVALLELFRWPFLSYFEFLIYSMTPFFYHG